MKREEFKKLIKEAVKEAIKEELISSLLEVLGEQKQPRVSNINKANLREEIRNNIPKPDFQFTTENIANLVNPNQPALNSQQGYNPGMANTSGEGSSLPAGEVSIDQISNLMTSK